MDELVGKKFGEWTVLKYFGRDKKSNKLYECLCSCGFGKIQRSHTLTSGDTTQCKSCRMKIVNRTENLIGRTFGKWSVKERIKNEDRNEWYYICICECGTIKKISGSQLKSGHSTRCHRCRVKTHGMSYTRTFKIWSDMHTRCNNKNNKSYHRYGGRGITVCDRWSKFENFLEDMGESPPNLQIDRINNDGNYEPENCRWVTVQENNANKSHYTTWLNYPSRYHKSVK